jgi:Flp pilus assembly protein TadD
LAKVFGRSPDAATDGRQKNMTRPIIVPSVIVLAFALSSCASMDMDLPFMNSAPDATAATEAGAPPNGFMDAGPANIEAAVALARTQRGKGDFNGATATLSQLVLLAPDDPRVLGEYGKTLVDRGETEDALAFLQRAIELNPGEWSYYSAQGVAFAKTGNFGAAQMAFSRALALNPNDPIVLNNLALAFLQAGNRDQAEALLARASQTGLATSQIMQNLALVRNLRVGASPITPNVPAITPAAPAPTLAPSLVPGVAPAIVEQGEALASANTAPEPTPVEAFIEPTEQPVEIAADESAEVAVVQSVAAPIVEPAVEPVAELVAEAVEVATAPDPVEEPVQVLAAPATAAPSPLAPIVNPVAANPVAMNSVALVQEPAEEAVENRGDEAVVLNEVIESSDLAEVNSDYAATTTNIALPDSGPIYFQLAAFSVKDNAVRLVERLEGLNSQVALGYAGETEIHSVSVGPYADRGEAIQAIGALEELGLSDMHAVNAPLGMVLTNEELAQPSPAEPADVEPADDSVSEPEAPMAPPALRYSENL